MINMLSVDLEDWFHFIGSKYTPRIRDWDKYDSRIVASTERLLEALGDNKATFFCLGWTAEKHKEVIRMIANAGHEIASHGYYHELVYELGPDKFRQDILSAKVLLESIVDQEITAYRAPGFSIRPEDDWAFDIIYETGHRLDSSVFPGVRTMGGIPNASPYPGTIDTRHGVLTEVPVSTASLFGHRTAFCGGGFFRFFPYFYMAAEIQRLNERGIPAVMYIHPRDIDPDQPRLKLEPVNSFMYHFGLQGAPAKFKRLMRNFKWDAFGSLCTST